jgi:serine/threonine protein kinase
VIQVGQQAGGYEFLGLRGSSRIGTAYKVRNLATGRIEILRVLDKEFQDDREQADRFLREIKVHARLLHGNIVSFYTAAEIDDQLVMTSEFFEGTVLQRRLDAGPMPVEEAVDCMSQVLAALDYAHENGVVHREVSPANILLGSDSITKLTGFGLAKSSADPMLTRPGTVMGWLEYMSPEQVKGSADLDARSDIYSAGAVLYEMVTGKVPFVCNSEFDLMMAHVHTPPVPPIQINPDLPEELSRIILMALAKDPSQRFQTAGQFRDALKAVAVALSPAVAPPQPVEEPPVPSEPIRTQRLLVFGVLAFILAEVVLFTFLRIIK